METTRRLPPFIFPFVSAPSETFKPVIKEIAPEKLTLKEALKTQVNNNDLVYNCYLDSEGNLQCQWVQACSII